MRARTEASTMCTVTVICRNACTARRGSGNLTRATTQMSPENCTLSERSRTRMAPGVTHLHKTGRTGTSTDTESRWRVPRAEGHGSECWGGRFLFGVTRMS